MYLYIAHIHIDEMWHFVFFFCFAVPDDGAKNDTTNKELGSRQKKTIFTTPSLSDVYIIIIYILIYM